MNIVQHDVAVEKISDTSPQLYRAEHSESAGFTELKELLQKVVNYSSDQPPA